MTSLRDFDPRPSIREAAADIGYHDELSTTIRYAWEEDRPSQDTPVSKGTRRSKRSTAHAIEGLLFGPYVTPRERKVDAGQAAGILETWHEGGYAQSEGSFDDWVKTPIETSEATRHVDLDAADPEAVTAELVEADAAVKDEDAATYCRQVIGTYVDTQIDSGLWREKPREVVDILERNNNTFLAELVDVYARHPEVTIGHTVYTEHVDPEEAETPDDYLSGLEEERFQPI